MDFYHKIKIFPFLGSWYSGVQAGCPYFPFPVPLAWWGVGWWLGPFSARPPLFLCLFAVLPAVVSGTLCLRSLFPFICGSVGLGGLAPLHCFGCGFWLWVLVRPVFFASPLGRRGKSVGAFCGHLVRLPRGSGVVVWCPGSCGSFNLVASSLSVQCAGTACHPGVGVWSYVRLSQAFAGCTFQLPSFCLQVGTPLSQYRVVLSLLCVCLFLVLLALVAVPRSQVLPVWWFCGLGCAAVSWLTWLCGVPVCLCCPLGPWSVLAVSWAEFLSLALWGLLHRGRWG